MENTTIEKPIRIQRRRTKGWKMPKNTVYVGRPSKWGNPFLIGTPDLINGKWKPTTSQRAFEKFDEWFNLLWINRVNNLMEGKYPIKNLKGKNLACWCPLDQFCHADILLKIANS